MNRITQEVNSLHRKRELTLLPSGKRPRTICIVTNDQSGESVFDSPEFLTFCKPTDFTSSKAIVQKDVIIAHITENADIQDEKPYVQLQDMKLIITPNTKVSASLTDCAKMLLSKVCGHSVTAERHLLHQRTDDHPLATESNKLYSYLPDEASEALVESHTTKDDTTDTSSHIGSKWLVELFEDKGPVFSENYKDVKEEVICQPDCSRRNVVHDSGFCHSWSQSAEVEVSMKEEHIFSENILFGEKEQEHNCSAHCSHYVDCRLNNSYPKEHIGNSIRDIKSEENILQLQIHERENVAICDAETKDQVNENSMNIKAILSTSCTDISMVPYDVAIARNTATKNVSLEINDLCGVKGEYAAGEMILKGWNKMADLTTEAPASARISQEPSEKGNNAGLYSVIDPAILSETDREAEEKHGNSVSAAGVELSPSIKASEIEVPPPLCLDVRTSQVSAPSQIRQFYHQCITQQCKDDNVDLCQSYTEPKAFPISTTETHNMTGNQSSSPCNPTNLTSAWDERQDSRSSVGLELNEQDRFESFPNSLDNVRTQEEEQSQVENSIIYKITTIEKREDLTSFEQIQTDEHMKLDKEMKPVEVLQQNELHKEDTTHDYISDWTEGGISDSRITCSENELEDKFELFSDHPYSAHTSMMLITEKKRKDVKDVEEEIQMDTNEYPETMIKLDLQQQNEHKTDTTEVAHVKCVSEWTENTTSASNAKLILVNEHKMGNKLATCSDYQHRAETCLVENTVDLAAFTSPPTSDATVPCQNESSHSQSANGPTTLKWRYFPVPSSSIQYNWRLGEVDTFQKIQFSSDDDDGDNDACPVNTSVLTSFPEQQTPQQQLSHAVSEAVSNKYHHRQASEDEEKEEEELEEECHTKYMANGFLNNDTTCSDMPNLISAADVIAPAWPEQPNGESTCDSYESTQSDSNTQSKPSTASTGSVSPDSVNVDEYPKFEMKKQFDMVLQELHLFFDISSRDFASERERWSKRCHGFSEPLEANCPNSKQPISSAGTGCPRNTSTDGADENRGMEVCGGDPVVSYTSGQQEVPLGSHVCPETCLYKADKHREPQEVEHRRKMWSSSFISLPLLEQVSQRASEQHKRLEPLRTCTRPIRVGLSKRAKTKHLHRPHPYK